MDGKIIPVFARVSLPPKHPPSLNLRVSESWGLLKEPAAAFVLLLELTPVSLTFVPVE